MTIVEKCLLAALAVAVVIGAYSAGLETRPPQPMVLDTQVNMSVKAWVVQDGELKQIWEDKSRTSLAVCLTMSRIFNVAGRGGAYVVRCGDVNDPPKLT